MWAATSSTWSAATHASELLNRVPGAMVQRGSGEESLTAIRSPVLTGAGSCGAFLFLENGVPIRPVGFCNVNEMLEINTEQADAIEVIRGTGTALYGSNAVHGIVNVLQDAPAELPKASVGLEAGPSDYQRVKAAGSLAGDATQFGAKALYTHDGGWRDSAGFDEAKLNATLANDATTSTVPTRVDLAATWLDQETAGFRGQGCVSRSNLAESNPNPEAYRKASAVRLTGLLRPPTSLPGQLEFRPYLRYFAHGVPAALPARRAARTNGQESAGLMSTFTWNTGPKTSLVTGLDLEWANSFLLEQQALPTTGGSPAANAIRPAGKHYDYDVVSNVAAAYGQFEYALTGQLHAGLGLRAEYVGYDYDNRMLAGNTSDTGVPCQPTACLYSRPADRNDSFTNLVPKLSLRWNPHDNLMVYANASRGFRPPEITEMYRLQRDQTVADLDSEQIDSLEIGMKASIETLRIDLAGFDMRKKHVILRDTNGFNLSDGRTTHKGVEYQVTWQALEQLSAVISGTYAQHVYDFSQAIEAGETITKGNDIDTAPRELLRAALDYRPLPTVATEAEWLRVGDYWLDAANAHRYGGYELLNLRASWQVTPRWTAALRVNNALDRAYADRADFAFGSYRYFPGRERSVFAEVNWTVD